MHKIKTWTTHQKKIHPGTTLNLRHKSPLSPIKKHWNRSSSRDKRLKLCKQQQLNNKDGNYQKINTAFKYSLLREKKESVELREKVIFHTQLIRYYSLYHFNNSSPFRLKNFSGTWSKRKNTIRILRPLKISNNFHWTFQ